MTIQLLAKYMIDKLDVSKDRTGIVHRINKAELFAIEKYRLFSFIFIQKVKLDHTFDLSHLKALGILLYTNNFTTSNIIKYINIFKLTTTKKKIWLDLKQQLSLTLADLSTWSI